MKNLSISLSIVFITLLLNTGLSLANADKAFYERKQLQEEISAKNLKVPGENIVTGGQPSKTDIKKLSEKGIKTVINFRGDGEFERFNEAQEVQSSGMSYVHIPIDSREALNKENVAKFRAALDGSDGGTFLHCGSGNRVGALFALDAYWNQNKSAEEALKIGEEAGLTSLKGHIESMLQQ